MRLSILREFQCIPHCEWLFWSHRLGTLFPCNSDLQLNLFIHSFEYYFCDMFKLALTLSSNAKYEVSLSSIRLGYCGELQEMDVICEHVKSGFLVLAWRFSPLTDNYISHYLYKCYIFRTALGTHNIIHMASKCRILLSNQLQTIGNPLNVHQVQAL